eukprot:1783850-Prymnesium_polylepis.2
MCTGAGIVGRSATGHRHTDSGRQRSGTLEQKPAPRRRAARRGARHVRLSYGSGHGSGHGARRPARPRHSLGVGVGHLPRNNGHHQGWRVSPVSGTGGFTHHHGRRRRVCDRELHGAHTGRGGHVAVGS